MDKSSAEIAQEISDKEAALKAAIGNQSLVEQENLILSKEILTLQAKRKDLEIAKSKADHIVKDITIDLRTLKNRFWASKNEGL